MNKQQDNALQRQQNFLYRANLSALFLLFVDAALLGTSVFSMAGLILRITYPSFVATQGLVLLRLVIKLRDRTQRRLVTAFCLVLMAGFVFSPCLLLGLMNTGEIDDLQPIQVEVSPDGFRWASLYYTFTGSEERNHVRVSYKYLPLIERDVHDIYVGYLRSDYAPTRIAWLDANTIHSTQDDANITLNPWSIEMPIVLALHMGILIPPLVIAYLFAHYSHEQ